MTMLLPASETTPANPLDLVEQIVTDHEWPFDRQGDDELMVGVAGKWSDYQLWFSWRADYGALQFSCAFDLKVSESRRRDLHSLIVLLNEKLWLGHFDLWQGDGLLVFRHALLLRGGFGPTTEQIEDLVEIALSECERFYPAFQFAMWGGKSPREAIEAAMLETQGEA
jgi:hypothetical protein